MKKKIVTNKTNVSNFTVLDHILIGGGIIILDFVLYQVCKQLDFLTLFFILLLFSFIYFSFIFYQILKKAKLISKNKNNPLNFFISKSFEEWLINTKICNKIEEDTFEIPMVSISKDQNRYYLDIQEFYDFGNKLIDSNESINAFAYQNGCDMRVIESFRYKGVIRYVFMKTI